MAATVDISYVAGNTPPIANVDISRVEALTVFPAGATVDISMLWGVQEPPSTATVSIASVFGLTVSRTSVDISSIFSFPSREVTVDIFSLVAVIQPEQGISGVLMKELVSGAWLDPYHWRPMIRVGGTFVPL